jgi:hypothetical protein
MKKFLITIFAFFLPVLAQAQNLSEIKNVNNLATRLIGIGNIVIYFLISLAVIYIIWNTVHYFIRPAGADRKDAGMNILWGIIGLFVIVSIWGLVNILVNTFYTNPNIPQDRFPNANFINRNGVNSGVDVNAIEVNPFMNRP